MTNNGNNELTAWSIEEGKGMMNLTANEDLQLTNALSFC